jgi:hypothetical protein
MFQGDVQGSEPVRGLGLDRVIGGETSILIKERDGIHSAGKIAELPFLGAVLDRKLAIFMTWLPRIL